MGYLSEYMVAPTTVSQERARGRTTVLEAKIGLALAATMTFTGSALAGTATRAPFGKVADGPVELVTLDDGHGTRARIMTWGATLQALEVPDRDGTPGDIVLGYNDVDSYVAKSNYFGATVGRYANRIAKGQFTLDGKTYTLPINNNGQSLHGGTQGFDKHLWTIVKVESGATSSVTLAYTSADGEMGYPGKLDATATYALDETGVLRVDYRATTDKPTIVNITNHSYFNLGGEASGHTILDERLTLPAQAYTPVDAVLIPTGELRKVEGTPFDFRTPRRIGDRVRDGRDEQIHFGQGYDHNFVLDKGNGPLHLAARVEDPRSGRVMEITTDQPGVQFYSGNFLDGTAVGKSGHSYRQSDAIALEPQVFPDTPNHPAFGSARLDPGQTYHSTIVYTFSTLPK